MFFYAADVDQSGLLSVDEIRTVLEKMGVQLTKAEFTTVINEFIGENNQMNYEQFKSLIENICEWYSHSLNNSFNDFRLRLWPFAYTEDKSSMFRSTLL